MKFPAEILNLTAPAMSGAGSYEPAWLDWTWLTAKKYESHHFGMAWPLLPKIVHIKDTNFI
ncbi:MAG: hypothetical protein P4L42_16305 [Desulfocapsaceae bacterium]|nr:hypothetical protein [Desulfocapsaceae bacterium]